MDDLPEDVKKFVDRLYGSERRRYECVARTPEEFATWQTAARSAFVDLLKLPVIAEHASGHTPNVSISTDKEDLGDCFRQQGSIETEPDVQCPFWILTPKGNGPFPLAITPHGHGTNDKYVGIWQDEQTRERIKREDCDVAVQAATRGFLTIAPATRGLGQKSFKIQDCGRHSWQVMLAGRTMMGERVWDLMRILDWALALPDVNSDVVLMLGNSGGGMATLHTAAADERVTIAVPCCSYTNYVNPAGALRHCTCNAIPGIMTFGEFWDVAGLVAPRRMLTVNGDGDSHHPVEEVEHAASQLKKIYEAAGAAGCYEHRFGHGGHRFYSDLMWPWIMSHGS